MYEELQNFPLGPGLVLAQKLGILKHFYLIPKIKLLTQSVHFFFACKSILNFETQNCERYFFPDLSIFMFFWLHTQNSPKIGTFVNILLKSSMKRSIKEV